MRRSVHTRHFLPEPPWSASEGKWRSRKNINEQSGCLTKCQYEGAARVLAEILHVSQRSDIWNDWAVAQAARGDLSNAKDGFQRALQLDPANGEAAANLAVVLSQSAATEGPAQAQKDLDSRFRSLAAKALHRDAIQRFRQGKIEEAAALMAHALNTEPSSVRWNDFGTIQLALNHVAGAGQGYRRALELDPQNQMAAVNLVVLLEELDRNEEAADYGRSIARELVIKQCDSTLRMVAQKCNSQLFEEYFRKYIRHVPDQDPSFPEGMMQALRRRRDSGFFVQHLYHVLTELPPDTIPSVVEALERLAACDHRFSSLLAFWHMKHADYDAALHFFQAAFDANPADLFAEAMIIACEHARHELHPEVPDRFAGIRSTWRAVSAIVPGSTWKSALTMACTGVVRHGCRYALARPRTSRRRRFGIPRQPRRFASRGRRAHSGTVVKSIARKLPLALSREGPPSPSTSPNCFPLWRQRNRASRSKPPPLARRHRLSWFCPMTARAISPADNAARPSTRQTPLVRRKWKASTSSLSWNSQSRSKSSTWTAPARCLSASTRGRFLDFSAASDFPSSDCSRTISKTANRLTDAPSTPLICGDACNASTSSPPGLRHTSWCGGEEISGA